MLGYCSKFVSCMSDSVGWKAHGLTDRVRDVCVITVGNPQPVCSVHGTDIHSPVVTENVQTLTGTHRTCKDTHW